MNKRIRQKWVKQNNILADKIEKLSDLIPHEEIVISRHGVTNWNQLSHNTKHWILHG